MAWYGDTFHSISPFCGESTGAGGFCSQRASYTKIFSCHHAGHWWIPLKRANNAELWCFFGCKVWRSCWRNCQVPGDYRCHDIDQAVEQTAYLLAISDVVTLSLMRLAINDHIEDLQCWWQAVSMTTSLCQSKLYINQLYIIISKIIIIINDCAMLVMNHNYCKIYSISRAKSQSLNVSCILLQLSSLNPLKPGVKLRMKRSLEQHRQALLQLLLSYQQFYCLLRCDLY